jgi:hypothetical protein
MDNKYLKILQYLKDNGGVGVYTNITPVLLQLYPGVNRMERYYVSEAGGQINRLLEGMKEDGFILVQQYTSIGSGNETNGYTWLDVVHIKASVKQKGLDALDEEINKGTATRLEESIIETNQSVRDANRATISGIGYQEKFGNRSLIIGAITTLFILVTIILSILDKTPQRLQDIKTVMQKQDSTLKNIQLSLEDLKTAIPQKSDTVYVKMKE